MDIEQFYDADPRRRHSEELEFGREWRDAGKRVEISWVADTGEVYSMTEPRAGMVSGIFGDEYVSDVPDESLVVEVLGVVAGRDAIEAVMSGWQDAMTGDDSVAWVRQRVAQAATELQDPPGAPSHDFPAD